MVKRILAIVGFVFVLGQVSFAAQDVFGSGTEVGNGGPRVMNASVKRSGTEVGNGGPKVYTVPGTQQPS